MNIGDIAEMAGVSRAAVSRYLNNGYLSDEKRERIRQVIEETGYKPSLMAQTLRTKKTKLVGVVLPRVNSDSISSVVEGIGAVLEKSGYEMLLASTGNSPDRELNYLNIFSGDRVDGVILVATLFTKEHIRILKESRIPLVIVGQKLPGFLSVFHDDRAAGAELTKILIERGRKKILYISVLREDIAVGTERMQGYLDTMAAGGLPVTEEMVITADFSRESGYEKMGILLERNPDADAVLCATDRIATGAMMKLKERGIRIPEDMALAGFGDNAVSQVTSPQITTVHFYYRESGETAAEKLIGMLENGETAAPEICFGHELKLRDSV